MKRGTSVGTVLSAAIGRIIHAAVHDLIVAVVHLVLNAYTAVSKAMWRCGEHRTRQMGAWRDRHRDDVLSGICILATLFLVVPFFIAVVVDHRHTPMFFLLGPVLLAMPFHLVAYVFLENRQRDRLAAWAWRKAASTTTAIRSNRVWHCMDSALETAWIPGSLLAINIVMAVYWPSPLLEATQPPSGVVPGGRIALVLLFYPVSNALAICIMLVLVGCIVAAYRAVVLNNFFRTPRPAVKFFLQLWPFPFLRFPKGMVLSAVAAAAVAIIAHDVLDRVHNETANNVAMLLILIALYVWSVWVSLFAFQAQSMYGPLTFFATAGGVWLTENFATPGQPPAISLESWVGLALNIAVAVAFTTFRIVRIMSMGHERAAAIEQRGDQDGREWLTPRTVTTWERQPA